MVVPMKEHITKSMSIKGLQGNLRLYWNIGRQSLWHYVHLGNFKMKQSKNAHSVTVK